MSLLKSRTALTAILLTVTAVAIGAATAIGLPTAARRGAAVAPARTAAVDARVALAPGKPVTVPRSFLGISAEYWTIPIWARRAKLLRRVVAMLSPYGTARLRIGGDSADRVRWSPSKEQPEWVFELTPAWLRLARRVVRSTGSQLILDLNTMSSTPKIAARWARTAIASLPAGSIRAFEVGNEPDIYNQSKWQHMTAGRGAPPLPKRITPDSYARSFGAYASAVAGVAHGIPLLAPALAEPQKNADWVTKLLAGAHPRLAGITAHRYPYSACARRTAPTFPSVSRILSETATAGMGRTALMLERITDRSKLPLWLTEINSVTCGGVKGVSNTFATALWAPDALFELLRAGTEAAFVHVRPPLVNMAFSLTRKGLTAYPLLYGMVLFSRTLGPGAELVPLRLNASPAFHLKAWGVRIRGGVMHVLLIDSGPRGALVRVSLPSTRPAYVQRLRAPGITSTAGLAFGHQQLTRSAVWAGQERSQRVVRSRAGYAVQVPRYSAALLTVRLS